MDFTFFAAPIMMIMIELSKAEFSSFEKESDRRRTKVKILDRMEKFPGGMVVIPMFITALVNTCFPQALEAGGVTTALFKDGTLTLIGLLLFFSGSQLKIDSLGAALRRGGVLAGVKILAAFASGLFLMKFFGPKGFSGVSTLALVTAISNNNPAVYLALVKKYGDEIDSSVFGLLCLLSMPVLPITVLGLSGGGFDAGETGALLIPFILGFALANLDGRIAEMTAGGTALMLPFLGFCFGASVNLVRAFESAGGGLLILAIYTAVTMVPQLAADRLLAGRPGYAALSSSAIGGTAVAIPAIAAGALPSHAPYAEQATAQLALAMTLSCLLTPLLTGLWVQRCRRREKSERDTNFFCSSDSL